MFRLGSVLTKENEDELIYLIDSDAKNNDQTKKLVNSACCFENRWDLGDVSRIKQHSHSLNADYGTHKNYGTLQCKGDYIFQIDGDELPFTTILGENLHSIIESNPEVELIFVPRINDYKGVKEEHARQWGWRLTDSKKDGVAQGRPLINFPDFQGRIFKNVPDRIKWDRKLHEKIEGHTQYSFLPAEEDYAIYHDKTIEKQLETNLRYNKVFTKEDNMGHKVV
jgi:glycosyltransferase involved in cell wall biosynthesis